ncbi:hypothetical protein PFISCL1PPCAC_6817, partial [Pristionchus fissidentatus]
RRPTKRRLIDVDSHEDDIRWVKMSKMDHVSRFEQLERDASEAIQRSPKGENEVLRKLVDGLQRKLEDTERKYRRLLMMV